jgi:peptidoglycan hydrolase CwlO-like protein
MINIFVIILFILIVFTFFTTNIENFEDDENTDIEAENSKDVKMKWNEYNLENKFNKIDNNVSDLETKLTDRVSKIEETNKSDDIRIRALDTKTDLANQQIGNINEKIDETEKELDNAMVEEKEDEEIVEPFSGKLLFAPFNGNIY